MIFRKRGGPAAALAFRPPPFRRPDRDESCSNRKDFAMKVAVRHNRDFWAGVMLIGIGAAAMWIARDYRFGSALLMGPGFFPTILGGILIALGSYVTLRGLRQGGKIQGSWSPRALILLSLAMILFGVLMKHAGFIPALAVLILMAAAANRKFKLDEVLLLSALLILLSVAVFIGGLGLPFSLIRGF